MSETQQLSFKKDLWDSFETICTRLKQASVFQSNFANVMNSYAKETRDYARKILAIANSKDEEELFTLNAGWLGAKQEMDKLANLFLKTADDITYKVSQPVENHLKETQKIKRKGKETGRKLISDLTESVKVLSAAKADYEKAMRVYDQTKSDNERAANLNELYNSTKVKKKLETDKKRAEIAEKKYRRAVDKSQQLETKLFDTEMPRIMTEFEDMERTRVATIRSSLESFSRTYLDMMPLLDNVCSNIDSHVKSIDADGDVDQFILSKRTGRDKETHRTQFEEYNSQYKSCMKDGDIPQNSPSIQRANSLRSSTSFSSSPSVSPQNSSLDLQKRDIPNTSNTIPNNNNNNIQSSIPNNNSYSSGNISQQQESTSPYHSSSSIPVNTPVQNTPPPQSTTTKAPISFCRGLHNYTATQPSELSFKQGDVIKVLEKDPSGWWVGELNGKMGFFPSVDWVEEIQNTPNVPPPVNRASKQIQTPYQSPVVQHQQVPIQQSTPMHNQQNYNTPPINSGPITRRCKALFPMQAQNANELTLAVGDIIQIEKEADGWYLGVNSRGQRGIFPASFVVLE